MRINPTPQREFAFDAGDLVVEADRKEIIAHFYRSFEKARAMSDTVTVACKMPNGLILRLYEMIEIMEPVMGGGMRPTMVARPHPDGREYTINGNRTPYGAQATHEISHGYGLTPGVDREFFEKWISDNKNIPAVRNGLIFAHAKADQMRGHVKEMEGVKTLLEPLDTNNLSRDERVKSISMRRLSVEKATNT
jgi:hypothetical protein